MNCAERIKSVMCALFCMEEHEFTPKIAFGQAKQWDSIAHLNLVLALEEEFGLRFSDDEVADMLNFILIENIVSERLR